MLKLLITGSNGLLGQKLLAALKGGRDFSVIATSRQLPSAPRNDGSLFEQLDITQKEAVDACFARHRPDIVIHTAAMTLVDLCEQEKEKCWAINVKGTENLVRVCEKTRAHFIHLSTDFIFDGENGPYREEAIPTPVNYYGVSKLESEQIVRKSNTPWSVVRTVLVYGYLPQMARSNIVLFVKKNLEQRKSIRVVEDQSRMPTLAEDLAWACLEIAKKRIPGIFHISGGEFLNVYEIAHQIAAVFELDATLIQPVTTASLNEPAKRPPRTGFILDKAKSALGYQPRTLREGLKIVKQQMG